MRRPEVLVAVTVDTEEEWDWNGPFPRPPFSTRNTRRIPELQAFCAGLGLRPTYLVDYAVAADPESVRILEAARESDGCEIGAHLHPWCTPPVTEEISARSSHAVNLPKDLVEEKLANLTRLLAERFGARPRSFRSGRWGIDGPLLQVLARQGYEVDSSIFPFYADPDAFSYDRAPSAPYWPDWGDCQSPGAQREIFEIPVSSGFNRTSWRPAHRLHRLLASPPLRPLRGVGVLWRLGVLRKLCASPEMFDGGAIQTFLASALACGEPVINLFFHSSSLLPGATPFVATEEGVRGLFRALAESVALLRSRAEVVPVTLSEARDVLQRRTA